MRKEIIGNAELYLGDCLPILSQMDAESVQCCVTSPPYWGLRDYGHEGQLGLEKTPEEYVAKLVAIFREVRSVLKDDATLWLNLGDCYAAGGHGGGGRFMDMRGKNGSGAWSHRAEKTGWRSPPAGLKPKDLVGIPWRTAFALQADGWWLRQDIIWSKSNPMPESVTDRCTKAHEYIFLLTKSAKYYYDAEAIKDRAIGGVLGNISHKGKTAYENGDERMRTKVGLTEIGAVENRNRRSVWTVSTKSYNGAHFATFPPDLIQPCILAGSKPGDTILDPFIGSGTTGEVALSLSRKVVGIELNEEYMDSLAIPRVRQAQAQQRLFA